MSQIDLVFCCDCTASMSPYIQSAQDNIRSIATNIHKTVTAESSVRYGLVKYRDHPPQDSTFVTEVFPFTSSIDSMQLNIDSMSARGGGDGPEAVSAALHQVNLMEWRPNATKVCVLIADAPPHGLGETGDGFPNGCPMGTDPIASCKEMAAKGVTIYAVGVEPVLSTQYKFARDFMMAVAKITDGKFLPLGRASILAEIIVAGTLEGANLQALWERLDAETAAQAAANGETLTSDERVRRVELRLKEEAEKVAVAHVDVTNPYMDNYDFANCDRLVSAMTLGEGLAQQNPCLNAQVPHASAAFGWGCQSAQCSTGAVSAPQQSRLVGKAKKMMGLF